MFKRVAAAAAMTLFVLAGAPAVSQPAAALLAAPSATLGDSCYDGCMINCLKTGDLLICEDTCFQVTCPVFTPTKMTRVDDL